MAKEMNTYNSLTPGLLQDSKRTLPIRPIVSSINCPNNKLASFLTEMLTNSCIAKNDF